MEERAVIIKMRKENVKKKQLKDWQQSFRTQTVKLQ